jgi:hypothetical protein
MEVDEAGPAEASGGGEALRPQGGPGGPAAIYTLDPSTLEMYMMVAQFLSNGPCKKAAEVGFPQRLLQLFTFSRIHSSLHFS